MLLNGSFMTEVQMNIPEGFTRSLQYEFLYLNDKGDVFSLPDNKVLKQNTNKYGFVFVTIDKFVNKMVFFVHELYKDRIPVKPDDYDIFPFHYVVDFKDGNKNNLKLENLTLKSLVTKNSDEYVYGKIPVSVVDWFKEVIHEFPSKTSMKQYFGTKSIDPPIQAYGPTGPFKISKGHYQVLRTGYDEKVCVTDLNTYSLVQIEKDEKGFLVAKRVIPKQELYKIYANFISIPINNVDKESIGITLNAYKGATNFVWVLNDRFLICHLEDYLLYREREVYDDMEVVKHD